MNLYPGAGLGIGTAILGSTVGQEYPSGTVFVLCKIFGTLLLPDGGPVGSAGTTMTGAASWRGVTISAGIAVGDTQAGNVIVVDKETTITNEHGYFELFVIQGLTVNVTCSSFGKTVSVPTVGLTSVDISQFF